MSAELLTESTTITIPSEDVHPVEAESKMDTSAEVPGQEETGKSSKRKRSLKKAEPDETSLSNTRPRRTLPKRDEAPATKAKSERQSVEQDADDEQDREKNIPVLHDVADVVWVKMGGHPWWPSLIVRDPNDATQCFTKVSGNARAKRMYFVVFYGSTADFAWVADAATIPYHGVEAFTKYAQEMVDKAQTKSQKEQLTERFQLKVTIGRREDWETAVREADIAMKQTSETRLEQIEPKVQFYTSKLVSGKSRRTKTSDFDSEEERSSADEKPSMKIKLKKSSESNATPPAKRRHVRKSVTPDDDDIDDATAEFGQTLNGSSGESPSSLGNEKKSSRRPRISKPSVITNNGDHASPTPKKSITKPRALLSKASHPVSSLTHVLAGQHHRFDIRTGFLSPFEEQEVFDAIDQLKGNKSTFDEAEQIARRRFEQILCLNLNRTHVDIPEEWFPSFLFAHPLLIVKNPHWFNENISLDKNFAVGGESKLTLKHQLTVLAKLYRQELQVRSTNEAKRE